MCAPRLIPLPLLLLLLLLLFFLTSISAATERISRAVYNEIDFSESNEPPQSPEGSQGGWLENLKGDEGNHKVDITDNSILSNREIS